MNYNFDRIHPRRHTGSIKWEFVAEGTGFMRMNIACPRSILETALKRIRRSIEDLDRK